MYVCMYVYIYIHMYIYIYVYVYVDVDADADVDRWWGQTMGPIGIGIFIGRGFGMSWDLVEWFDDVQFFSNIFVQGVPPQLNVS